MSDEIESKDPNTRRVGYRNPPERTRFKPGQSGNPKGRPKGVLNMATVLERGLREKVVINENGKRKTVTKLEAAIKQLMNKSASGDLKALQLLATLLRSAEEPARQVPEPETSIDESEEKVLLGILERLKASGQKEQENEEECNAK